MAKIRVRIGFNQTGFLYSIKNEDSLAVATYLPGGDLPFVGLVASVATTAARPIRCWVLQDEVSIENNDGSLLEEGHCGDYLIETEYGELHVVRAQAIRDEYDLMGDVSRVYRTPITDSSNITDDVFGSTPSGTRF